MPIPHWREGYRSLLQDVAAAVSDLPGVDLTVECITHRFTAGSKDVLLGWYPRTKVEMDESARARKFGKYGSAKYVYPREIMAELRSWFENELATTLPAARTLLDIAGYGCCWTCSSASPVLRGPRNPTSRHSRTIRAAEPENTATGPSAASAGTAMNGMTVEVARDSE